MRTTFESIMANKLLKEYYKLDRFNIESFDTSKEDDIRFRVDMTFKLIDFEKHEDELLAEKASRWIDIKNTSEDIEKMLKSIDMLLKQFGWINK